jgi:hypothetical protein
MTYFTVELKNIFISVSAAIKWNYRYIIILIMAVQALAAMIFGHILFLERMVDVCETIHASTLSLLIPLPLRELVHNYAQWKQKWYNEITLRFLDNRFSAPFIKLFHLFLLYFRYSSILLIDFIERYVNINTFAIIISLICSRLHIAGYLIIFCLLFLRLDFAVISMSLFYKKHPNQLVKHFPGVYTIKRGMWKIGTKIIEEASSNPKVQAIGVAVAGAVAWKALDVYDTVKNEAIATLDRESTEHMAKEQLESTERMTKEEQAEETARQNKAGQAEAEQRQKDRDSEAEQRQKDRDSEAEQRQRDRDSAERIAVLEATSKASGTEID